MAYATPQRDVLRRQSLLRNLNECRSASKRLSLASPILNKSYIAEETEAEESAHRTVTASPPSRKASLSSILNESVENIDMASHFQTCLNLHNTNKISAKNVWALRIIDCLRQFATSEEENIFQMAALSLDISAKVYCLRVDDLYELCLKMASNFASTQDKPTLANGDDEAPVEIELEQPKIGSRKLKRLKTNQKQSIIERNLDKLFGSVKMLDPPCFHSKENIEASASDNLLSFNLGITSDHGFGLLSGKNVFMNGPDEIFNNSHSSLSKLPTISDFSIAYPCKDLEICAFDPEQEAAMLELPMSEDELPAAVLDGSIHDIFADQIEDESHEIMFTQDHQAPMHNGIENIVDFIPEKHIQENNWECNTLPITFMGKLLEKLWCGPSHWKFLRNKPAKQRFTGVIVGFSRKRPRKEIHEHTMLDPVLNFDETKKWKKRNSRVANRLNIMENIMIPLDWRDETAEERVETLTCFHIKPSMSLSQRVPIVGQEVISENGEEVEVYNYENANDSFYCTRNAQDDNGSELAEHLSDQGDVCFSQNLIDEPELVPDNRIDYAVRSKKMDIRKLKKSIWDTLTHNRDEAHIETPFSTVYKKLSYGLNETEQAETSSCIVFATMLHLCNENQLHLERFDLNDWLIKKSTNS